MPIRVHLDRILLERRMSLTELADRVGVTIANLRWNGRPVSSAAEARLQIGPHVRSVEFMGASAPANDR